MKISRMVVCVIALFALLCVGATSYAQNAVKIDFDLSWSASVARADGTPLAAGELGGYELNYRAVGANNWVKVQLAPDITNHQILDLNYGQWEFQIASYDSSGLYSSFTVPIVAGPNASPPESPGLNIQYSIQVTISGDTGNLVAQNNLNF